MTTSIAKVFIVDDHPRMRESLRKLVDFETDLCVCGEAGNVVDGLSGILQSGPDVAIVDLELGSETGLELVEQLVRAGSKVPVMILSMHAESVYAERSLKKGAAGYMMKSESSEQILHGLRQVLQGKIYLRPTMQIEREQWAH